MSRHHRHERVREAVPLSKEEVLRRLARREVLPCSQREMLRRLGIEKRYHNAFKRMVRELVLDGKLVKVGPSRYALPTGEDTFTGRVSRHADGFGFVIPESGGEDLYVSPRNLDSIFHGDRVRARVIRRGGHRRREAIIEKVVEPSRRRVMGLLRHDPQGAVLEAYDRTYAAGIWIDEVARSLRPLDGQVVGVEVTDAPSSRRPARGRLVEVLGFPDEPGMDIRTVVRKYELREEFPSEVLAEAERFPDPVPEAEISHREDFRDRPIVTIDGETAQDFDDAVQVEALPGGAYRLGVHIADVSYYVREGTELDEEALERGTSVYFPGTAIPMLPHRLSNGLCSLNPGVDRLTLSVLMEIDARGHVRSHRFAEGVIRSVERMTYTDVAKILEKEDPATVERYPDLLEPFRRMEKLARILNGKRRRRGTIDFDLPEPEILLDIQGATMGIAALKRNVAHRIIEEFMLAANETVAGELFTRRIPSLYRVHEKPDPFKLAELNRLLAGFGFRLPEPLYQVGPSHFQEILDGLEGSPVSRFLSRAMLRAMKLARYSPEKGIHYGLGASTYSHFTSPIRRYPDLMVHRILRQFLREGGLSEEQAERLRQRLPAVAVQSSKTERTADEAEREVMEWKKLAYMAERVGECFDGFISTVMPFGFFVEIADLFIEGLVHITSLPQDRYQLVERKQILRGERSGRVYKVGDPFRVRLDRIHQPQRRVDFSPAPLESGSSR